jgi:hypothetical protein
MRNTMTVTGKRLYDFEEADDLLTQFARRAAAMFENDGIVHRAPPVSGRSCFQVHRRQWVDQSQSLIKRDFLQVRGFLTLSVYPPVA